MCGKLGGGWLGVDEMYVYGTEASRKHSCEPELRKHSFELELRKHSFDLELRKHSSELELRKHSFELELRKHSFELELRKHFFELECERLSYQVCNFALSMIQDFRSTFETANDEKLDCFYKYLNSICPLLLLKSRCFCSPGIKPNNVFDKE